MFIHIGTKQRVKSLGESYEHCDECGGETIHAHREIRQWLTLYWIPVCPLGPPKRADYCQECAHKAGRFGTATEAREAAESMKRQGGPDDIDALRKKVQRGG